MGNRANVVFVAGDTISPAVYLHWQGGPESVYAFLDELTRRNIRPDADYEAARFVGIVDEFFNAETYGGLSLGIVNGPTAITAEELAKVMTDNGDNGFYVVDRTKNPRQVRRFLWDWDASNLVEKDTEWVEAEALSALTEPGMPGYEAIREFFVNTGKQVDAFN